MKKVARILMIGSVAVAGLSAAWLMITLLFQRGAMQHDFGMVMESLAESVPPMVPLKPVISCLGTLALMIVLLFIICDQRISWILDAVCAGGLVVGLPLLAWVSGLLQSHIVSIMGYASDDTYLSLLNSVCSKSQMFMGLATGLALVACGMSIAVKYFYGKK